MAWLDPILGALEDMRRARAATRKACAAPAESDPHDRDARLWRTVERMRADGAPPVLLDRVIGAMGCGLGLRDILADGGVAAPTLARWAGAARAEVGERDGEAAVTATPCDECHDGFVFRPGAAAGRGGYARCECWYLARSVRAINAAGLPFTLVRADRSLPWDLEHPNDPADAAEALRVQRAKVRRRVMAWADGAATGIGTGRTLALIGRPGTRKSRLAVGAAYEAAKALGRSVARDGAPPVFYATWATLAAQVLDARGAAKAELTERVRRSPVLIIDEVGEPVRYAGVADDLREAIKGRHDRNKWTLLASNHLPGKDDTGADVRGRWGHLTGADALISRCEVLTLTGPDWRSASAQTMHDRDGARGGRERAANDGARGEVPPSAPAPHHEEGP